MGAWDKVGGALFGRAPSEYDPHKEDRAMRMSAYGNAMGQYDQMMSTPGGAIPQAYRDHMMGEVDKDIRNQNPGAGQSGFTADRVSRGKNDLRVKLLGTELGQLNKQRDYMQQLATMSQPTTQLPGQTGMLQQMGGDLAGRSARAGGDAIFGKEKDEEYEAYKRKQMFGSGANNQQTNGMGVQG